jgi:hypothetical protein
MGRSVTVGAADRYQAPVRFLGALEGEAEIAPSA